MNSQRIVKELRKKFPGKKIIVTSYRNPDLDGVACSIAYSELLNKTGKDAKPTYFGRVSLEVDYIREYSGEFPIDKKNGGYSDEGLFVLVDTSDPDAIDPAIPVEKVIEIFDHRKLVFTKDFINAKINVEQVGSCATLITEEFKKHKINPGKIAGLYLYGAIVSNTINFKNMVTTKRDKLAANWLKSSLKLPTDFIKQMFLSKSNVNSSNFEKIIEQDFSTKEIKGKKVGIAQLEVAELDNFIDPNKDELENFLKRLRRKKKLDYILFTGIDILKGFNRFIVVEEKSKKLFKKVLSLKTFPMDTKVDYIIMRKQIWPKLKNL